MANIKSAKKRIGVINRKTVYNRRVKSSLKGIIAFDRSLQVLSEIIGCITIVPIQFHRSQSGGTETVADIEHVDLSLFLQRKCCQTRIAVIYKFLFEPIAAIKQNTEYFKQNKKYHQKAGYFYSL